MNCKRKSRHRFFLLMRSGTPPIYSEFRGGLNTPNPPLGTPLPPVSVKVTEKWECTSTLFPLNCTVCTGYVLRCSLADLAKVSRNSIRLDAKPVTEISLLLQINVKTVTASMGDLQFKMVCRPRSRGKWVPVTTAWRVLRLRMEERPPIWRVAANKLNKQSRTADEGWSSSLRVGRGANNASP